MNKEEFSTFIESIKLSVIEQGSLKIEIDCIPIKFRTLFLEKMKHYGFCVCKTKSLLFISCVDSDDDDEYLILKK